MNPREICLLELDSKTYFVEKLTRKLESVTSITNHQRNRIETFHWLSNFISEVMVSILARKLLLEVDFRSSKNNNNFRAKISTYEKCYIWLIFAHLHKKSNTFRAKINARFARFIKLFGFFYGCIEPLLRMKGSHWTIFSHFPIITTTPLDYVGSFVLSEKIGLLIVMRDMNLVTHILLCVWQ